MSEKTTNKISFSSTVDYLLHSTGTLLALSVFVPAFFFLVQNSHMFPIEYFAYATLMAMTISLGFFALGICWDNGVRLLPFSSITLNIKSLFLIILGGIGLFYTISYVEISKFQLTEANIVYCFVCFILGILFHAGTQRIAPCIRFSLFAFTLFLSLYLFSNFYILETDFVNDRNAEFFFNLARILSITLYCCICFIVGIVFHILIQTIPFANAQIKFPLPVQNISHAVVGVASALIIFYYSVFAENWFGNMHVLYVFCTIVSIIFAYITAKKTQKAITLMLLAFLSISIVRLPINIYSDYKTELNASFDEFTPDRIFNNPNIYLFYLESYNDINTMEKIFNVDNNQLVKELRKKKFIIYDNAHSNGPYTLASMYTCYTAQPEYIDIHRGYADVSMLGRSVIGGSTDNMLFSFLKDNGYNTISYFNPPSYFFYGRGPLTDENSFPEKDYSPTIKAELALNPTAPFMTSILKTIFLNDGVGQRSRFSLDPQKIIGKVKQIKESKIPTLFVFKKGAYHSPSAGYDWKQSKEWVASNYHKHNVESSNKEILLILDGIAKHDPNSIVILMGDHGAIRLRKIDEGCSSVEELNKKLVDNGFTMKELIQDRFGIFLAIKMPDYAQQDISFGHSVITPANLFRHVFAALDHNPEFLKNRKEDTFRLDYSRLKLTMDDAKK